MLSDCATLAFPSWWHWCPTGSRCIIPHCQPTQALSKISRDHQQCSPSLVVNSGTCNFSSRLGTNMRAKIEKTVLSKVQNRGSPNRPRMVDGWVVRITFGWSVYVVLRNYNKTLIMTSMLFVFHHHQGLYPKISLSLGRTRFLFKVLQSFWNLIGSQPATSGAKLPVKFQSDWSIFPNYTQLLLNCEKSVGNL